jgi:hypothetical protein
MAAAIRPEAQLLRDHQELLNNAPGRADVILFLPMRRWLDTERCVASELATALSSANIQYSVVSEEDVAFPAGAGPKPVFLVESMSVLTADEKARVEEFERKGGRVVAADRRDWLEELGQAVAPASVEVEGPAGVRVVVRDQPLRTIVHVLNLNVQRISSFQDKVQPATDVKLTVAVPFKSVARVYALTADEASHSGRLKFTWDPARQRVALSLDHLQIHQIIVIEP